MPYVDTLHLSFADVVDLLEPPQDRIESPYHVTDLLRFSDASIGEEEYKNKDGTVMEGLMDMGRLWEIVARPFIDKWAVENGFYLPSWSIPILLPDGIIANLDGILHGPEPSQLHVIESKARFSKPHDPSTKRGWMGQVMTYCRIVGTYKALMPVLYFPARPPSIFFKLHSIIFTEPELAGNWNRVQIARSMKRSQEMKDQEKGNQ